MCEKWAQPRKLQHGRGLRKKGGSHVMGGMEYKVPSTMLSICIESSGLLTPCEYANGRAAGKDILSRYYIDIRLRGINVRK